MSKSSGLQKIVLERNINFCLKKRTSLLFPLDVLRSNFWLIISLFDLFSIFFTWLPYGFGWWDRVSVLIWFDRWRSVGRPSALTWGGRSVGLVWLGGFNRRSVGWVRGIGEMCAVSIIRSYACCAAGMNIDSITSVVSQDLWPYFTFI